MLTTESDFQAALDAEPDNHLLRLIFADWLQERDDPRAAGYRALGVVGATPSRAGTFSPESDGAYYCFVRKSSAEKLMGIWRLQDEWIRGAVLDDLWCEEIYKLDPARHLNYSAGWIGYGRSVSDALDLGARAFTRLPAQHRAELLGTLTPAASPVPG